LIKLERYDLAHSLSEATRNYGSAGNGEAFARQAILSTEALLGLGLRAGATEELARATPWIERSRHAELVAYRYLMSSRLALAQGNASAAADEAKAGIEWCKPRQLGLHLAPLELALSTAESHERQSSANGLALHPESERPRSPLDRLPSSTGLSGSSLLSTNSGLS
jgi:hypothetical protein